MCGCSAGRLSKFKLRNSNFCTESFTFCGEFVTDVLFAAKTEKNRRRLQVRDLGNDLHVMILHNMLDLVSDMLLPRDRNFFRELPSIPVPKTKKKANNNHVAFPNLSSVSRNQGKRLFAVIG